MSVRYEWYQTDSKVVISILLKNAVEKNYKVELASDNVEFTATDCHLKINLHRPIVVERSSYKATLSKVEINLVKEVTERWELLEAKAAPVIVADAPPSLYRRDWDKLAKDFENNDAAGDKGEEALQELFQKIYKDADPEVRKAMNKSYSESGGTVLSTNWKDVGNRTVDMKPPDGTEFRKWEE